MKSAYFKLYLLFFLEPLHNTNHVYVNVLDYSIELYYIAMRNAMSNYYSNELN